MGTGSHRPQWEAAKGREDARSGIRHARSLPSHTRLKYRAAAAPMSAQRRAIAARAHAAARPAVPATSAAPSSPADGCGGGAAAAASGAAQPGPAHRGKTNSDTTRAACEPEPEPEPKDNDDDDSDSEAELRHELDLLNKRQSLLAQRDAQHRPAPAVSKWRSEATLRRTKPVKKRRSDMVNDPLQKAEHRDFLDKYLK